MGEGVNKGLERRFKIRGNGNSCGSLGASLGPKNQRPEQNTSPKERHGYTVPALARSMKSLISQPEMEIIAGGLGSASK